MNGDKQDESLSHQSPASHLSLLKEFYLSVLICVHLRSTTHIRETALFKQEASRADKLASYLKMLVFQTVKIAIRNLYGR